ncbi:MAG: hypothetical protein LBP59_04990 [Planctomycetaceae bacterium]|jgi:hypothetical protein|nr:hypothetical protein [Planctomycetaceae bacterium]
MTNYKLDFRMRMFKIILMIFVSIICVCFVTTLYAKDDKEKKTQTPPSKSPRVYRQQPRKITPQPKSNYTRNERPRRDITVKPDTRKSINASTTPKKISIENAAKRSDRNEIKRDDRNDRKLPTFRRNNQTITASGKVTTKNTPTQNNKINTKPKETPTTKTATPTVTPTTKTTQTTNSTTTPASVAGSNDPKNSTTKIAVPKTTDTVKNTRPVRTSDILKQRNRSDRKPTPNTTANNRNVNNPIIAPSENRINGLRMPQRNAEIAKAIARANQAKSSPRYKHQPPPATVKNIRKNFRGYNNYWTGDWYRRHPNSWRPSSISANNWWRRPYWRDTCNWFDAAFFVHALVNANNYYPYYYGTNIVYYDNMVYVNGVPYISSAEYYRQALELARTADDLVKAEMENAPQVVIINQQQEQQEQAKPNQPEQTQPEQIAADWLPMGTFAFLNPEIDNNAVNVNENNTQNISHEIVQIATNKTGQIRGNFVDEKNNTIRQLTGAIDAKTQRVAMRFVDDDKIVWECGLWNLTQDTVPILIHSGENKVEQKTLIRLVDDNDNDAQINTNDETELAP